MAANPRCGPSDPTGERKLSLAEARFYAAVFGSARKSSLAELRRLGGSEEEAEEIFTSSFEYVMKTVNPIARGFSEAQMVSYAKRACWTHMVAERRRRGLRTEIELGEVRALADPSSPSPEEIAEEREAAAIGREALQILPERDRLVFRQRHQMDLSPEEIMRNTPGLSPRTYRKIIQRANARVLVAYEQIRGGERCEEMRADLLRRYIAEQSPNPERRTIEAHLAHCRACRRSQSRMRGYLADVAGALLIVSSKAEPSRGLREQVKDVLLRLAARLPGQGSEMAAGQALSASTLKVASVCAGVAASACLATGIVPGVGVLAHQGSAAKPPPRGATHPAAPRRASLIAMPPTRGTTATSSGKRNQLGRELVHEGSAHTTPPDKAASSQSYSASEAQVSGRQVGTEMGAESGGTPLSTSQVTEPAGSSPTSSSTGAATGSNTHASPSEFGM
jgi:RNA polymerase sigma factor (sigma-70 family)